MAKIVQPDGTYRIERTGRLQCLWYVPRVEFGRVFRPWPFHCVDCWRFFSPQNDSASVIEARVMSDDGKVILLCPWCRADSAPGKHGRES